MTAPYYDDGQAQLWHGDCLEHRGWLDADVLVTDPPYGIRWESTNGGAQLVKRADRIRTRDALAGDGDASLRDAAIAAWGPRPAVVFGSWRVVRPVDTRSLLIWHKDGAYSGASAAPFFTNHEEIYILGPGWPRVGKPLRSVLTTSEHRSQYTARIGHPTPKPIALMERLLTHCPPGVIADPFAGSGSTLVAARNLGRRAIGVEMEERYCEVAARRLAQDCLDFGAAS